jgi:hypothetical protein
LSHDTFHTATASFSSIFVVPGRGNGGSSAACVMSIAVTAIAFRTPIAPVLLRHLRGPLRTALLYPQS